MQQRSGAHAKLSTAVRDALEEDEAADEGADDQRQEDSDVDENYEIQGHVVGEPAPSYGLASCTIPCEKALFL